MRASRIVVRWVQLAIVCGLAGVLVASLAPSAGAVAHTHRHHRRHHHHKHHRRPARHARLHAAQQARARLGQGCANADTPATAAPLDAMKAAVVCLINQQRNARGLPSLRVSTKLNRSAQGWNGAMIASGNFWHGSNFAGRISAVGYDWQMAGENIATGYPTPRSVVSAWMASTDHCRNILDPGFRDVGTGVGAAPVGNFASGPSTWTQDFGLLMRGSAPSRSTGPQNGCPY